VAIDNSNRRFTPPCYDGFALHTNFAVRRFYTGAVKTKLAIASLLCCIAASAQDTDALIAKQLPSLLEIYQGLHRAPELSRHEKNTSALLAAELRKAGFTVTDHVGKYSDTAQTGYGVVAVMKNGKGPVLLIRSDMDALPVEEQTGLPYASTVRTKNDQGQEVPVMHACGHDVHMATLIGVARVMKEQKARWHGTLVLVGQPAEEVVDGARAMVNDGFFERFPVPDYAIALHDDATIDAGKVTVAGGYIMASSTSVELVVRGLGGHGSAPESTKDPIVTAAEIITSLQTIVSREMSPFDPAVVTVGSIHGGLKGNVKLQLTVRTYKEDLREKMLASIARIAKGIAIANGIPEDRAPVMTASDTEHTPATYNDPKLSARVEASLRKAVGESNVSVTQPTMVGEDFGRFGRDGKIPTCMFRLGAVDPVKAAEIRRTHARFASLHSSLFQPLPEPTLRTGVKTMTTAAIDLLQ
jgi:amidohydrolase